MLPGLMRSFAAPRRGGLDREAVIEVDIGHHRQRRSGADGLEAVERVGARDGDAYDLAAGVSEAHDLSQRGVRVARVGVRHRLNADGSPAAYGDLSHAHCARLAPHSHAILPRQPPTIFATSAYMR